MGPKEDKRKKAEAAAAAAAAAAAIAQSSSDEEGDLSMKEMMHSMMSQLSTLNKRMDKVDNIEKDVKSLHTLFEDLKAENRQLKTEAKVMDKKLQDMNSKCNDLEDKVNRLEQHHRGWSIRVLNLPVTEAEEKDPFGVINKVYTNVLLPILSGAIDRKLLGTLPSAHDLLEVAHVLPAKSGSTKPIIARFYNRNLRDLCIRLKKDFAPRETGRTSQWSDGAFGGTSQGRTSQGGASGGTSVGEEPNGKGRYMFPFHEDLTRATFLKMRAIAKDERVKSCWSIKGQIKFTLESKPNDIRKVNSIFDSLDDILK